MELKSILHVFVALICRCIWLSWGHSWHYEILQGKSIWTYWKENTALHTIFYSWWDCFLVWV